MGNDDSSKPNRGGRPLKDDGLIWRESKGWCHRPTIERDGVKVRPIVALGTRDRLVARRKRERELANPSSSPKQARAKAAAALTVREALERTLDRWRADGVETIGIRLSALRRFALGCAEGCTGRAHAEDKHAEHTARAPHHIGERQIADVSKAEIEAVYAAVVKLGRSRQTLVHLRNFLSAVFDDAWRDDLTAANPVSKARLPKAAKKDNRPRAVMTEGELIAYLEWQHPDEKRRMAVLERQTMAAVSWCYGGLRTGELHAMRWEDFAEDFATGKIRRRKTDELQALPVPAVLQPYLERWWRRWGSPRAGLVFPCLRGEGAGKQEKRGVSHAAALRRDLARAFEIETWNGSSWTRKPRAKWTRRQVELLTDTETSRCVDFHSFRRATAGALAAAGVNEQVAMAYLNHSDSKTHRRYWSQAQILDAVPGALPALPLPIEPSTSTDPVLAGPPIPPTVAADPDVCHASIQTSKRQITKPRENRRAGRDSNARPLASEAVGGRGRTPNLAVPRPQRARLSVTDDTRGARMTPRGKPIDPNPRGFATSSQAAAGPTVAGTGPAVDPLEALLEEARAALRAATAAAARGDAGACEALAAATGLAGELARAVAEARRAAAPVLDLEAERKRRGR